MYLSTKDLPAASRDAALRPSDTVDTNGAAKILGLSPSTLSKLRAFRPHESPRFLKCGRRVLYRVGDLQKWQEQRLTGGHPRRPLVRSQAMEPRQDEE